MSALKVAVRCPSTRSSTSDDVVVEAEFTNTGSDPVAWSRSQAERAALVFEVRDRDHRAVHLPPPSVPTAADAEKRDTVRPGESIVISYASFLPDNLGAGEYELRHKSHAPETDAGDEDAIRSEWIPFEIERAREAAPSLADAESVSLRTTSAARSRFLFRLSCWIRRLLGIERCDRVRSREVDEPLQEVITDAPAPYQAWNGTYSWNARFRVVVDEARCTAKAIIRIRIIGTITAAQRAAWESAIEAAWSRQFKLCCDRDCCCKNGYTVDVDIDFVASGEHHVVNAGASTTNMTNWGAADTIDVSHEVGHMLGNVDEYFTVNGIPYGAFRQPDGNIMNNPANPPDAHHYELIRRAVVQLVGRNCRTVTVRTNC